MSSRLCISFDFELGWGVLDTPEWKTREQLGWYKNLRTALNHLTDFLYANEIQTTWAMVSSMFVESITDLKISHLNHQYQEAVETFFTSCEYETRCALDCVELFNQRPDLIEVCSHTSTHLYPTLQSVSATEYVSDISNSILDLTTLFKRPVKSLVLPRDDSTFLKDLIKVEQLNVRVNPSIYNANQHFSRRSSTPASRIVLGQLGETYQSGSLFFNPSPGGRFNLLRKASFSLQLKSLIKKLQTTQKTYHVWLHPFNLVQSPIHMKMFMNFLGMVAEMELRGSTKTSTMREIGDIARRHMQ